MGFWRVTGLSSLEAVTAAADALDEIDPCPADAVSWFEEGLGRFRFEAYAADKDDADAVIAALDTLLPGLHAEPVDDADWVAMALDGLPPVRAGRFVVAGAHALAGRRAGRGAIWIEASEAFGTGHHGTTRGCLLALDALLRRGVRPRRVLDVGTGSGVLAIAAARFGAFAEGVEIDARAAAIAKENVRNNRVAARARMRCADGALAARARPGGRDLVFANILMRPLVALAPALVGALRPGGRLILSGLLARQVPLVRLAYEGRGLVLRHKMVREGWATLAMQRP
jgi:ribosomal protein L11 methyltransferase